MKETISRKYLAVLALASLAILAIGGRYRPRDTEPSPSPTETATLEASVRRDQAAAIPQYLASRAAELADQAVFLPASGTTGVRYQSPAKVLTVDGSGKKIEPMLAIKDISSDVRPAPAITSSRNSDNWLLIIGRTPEGQPLWTAVLQSVQQTAVCNDVTYQRLVANVMLDMSFAGAGVFDLDGSLAGIMMPCGGALDVVSIGSVPELLAKSNSPERALAEQFGFRTTPLQPDWQDLYPAATGLIVTDVWTGRWADRNGLLPGDLIVTEAPALDATNIGAELKVSRAGRKGFIRIDVQSSSQPAGLAVVPPTGPLPELLVAPDSAAERAGLRNGDRLVSIPGQKSISISRLSKMLSSPGGSPVRIVYERGKKRGVVEVPHE